MMNHHLDRKAYTAWVLVLICIGISLLMAGCEGKSAQSVSADQSGEPHNAAESSTPGWTPTSIEIPKDTHITVRLLQTVSSRSARSGDSVDAEVAHPVMANGVAVIPERARARVRVVDARPSGRLETPGYLGLILDAVQTSDGNWINIDSNTVSRSGKSHKRRNLTLIGGAAGVGALIGGVAGGGKGSAIGAAAGAGAGTAGAYATGQKDISFEAESKLIFRLEQALILNR